MKRILLPLLAAIALPTAVNAEFMSNSQITDRDKAGWTGGYGYGFLVTLCEAKRLNIINEAEFKYLRKRVINTYKEFFASVYYSEEVSPLIYRLEDESFNQACIKFNDLQKD